jgi:1-acyl-sn-glycerol-3-phosphate acyltransferase
MRSTSTGDRAAAEQLPGPGDSERLYRTIRSVSTPLYKGLLRVKVEHRDRVPPAGGAIVAANHISFFDSVALLQSIPRRAFFIGKAEYMHSWTTRRLFPAMGLIPIEREQARKAIAALEVAASVLDRGDVLTIYPEGTRSRDGLLHKGHTGVAQLALMSGAPIVPVGLVGTDHIQPIGCRVPRPFRRAVVRFGEPLDPAAYGGSSRRRRQMLTDDLMEAIRRLSRQAVSDDFASLEPPLVRGGTESVYQVHSRGGVGASFAQAARFAVAGACSQFDDGRVGSISRLGCRIQPDGTVRFSAEVAVSVKYQPQELRS